MSAYPEYEFIQKSLDGLKKEKKEVDALINEIKGYYIFPEHMAKNPIERVHIELGDLEIESEFSMN